MTEPLKIGTLPVEIHATLPGGAPLHIGTIDIDLTMATTGNDVTLRLADVKETIQAAFAEKCEEDTDV